MEDKAVLKRNLMKKLILVFILFQLISIRTVFAFEDVIYFNVPISGSKTEIYITKPDGEQIKKILVNGIMPRISPDGRFIAYLEQTGFRESVKSEPVFELALADRDGNKIKSLATFLHNKHKDQMRVAKFRWSPDSRKITVLEYLIGVILKDNLRHIMLLNIVDVEGGKIKNVHQSNVLSQYDAAISTVEWFPDNKIILFSNTRTISIIDIELNTSKVLIDQGFSPRLTKDGERIIFLVKKSAEPKSAVGIWQYRIKDGKKENILDSELYFAIFSINNTSDKIIFQGIPTLSKSGEITTNLYLFDTSRKKLDQILLPKGQEILCPMFLKKDNLINGICHNIQKEMIGYCIFDLEKKSLTFVNKFEKENESLILNIMMGSCDETWR
ncbi:MAG: PD40 domain-containing protein [Nitrospirae bacterium]|nr:PD40 domain-containing protein [Nitrospirota bacterium]